MLLLDVNVLVHAFRPDVPNSHGVLEWLEGALAGPEPVGIAEPVWAGFLRIVTNPRVFTEPAPMPDALAFLDAAWAQPSCLDVVPGARHRAIFRELCESAGVRADRVPDAYLAALAIETGGELVTTDRGFARYPGLRWRLPA